MFTIDAPVKNILLLYPETPRDSYWSFSHALDIIGKKASTPPLGLLTVAGMLPNGEFNQRLIDMNVSALTEADIAWADIIFVSAMIAQKESLESVLLQLRNVGKPVVAGGPYTSTAYREAENVDCFVIGEAEAVWDAFLSDMRRGTLRPAYAAPVRPIEAAALRSHFGPDAHIASAPEYPDINRAPLPRYDLLDIDKYSLMPVQASRGCPVGCEFCDIWRRFGRKSRNKNYERLLAEMEALYRLGWRDTVFLVDDNFIGNKPRAKELLRVLADWQRERNWPFAFLTEATLSMADDDELLDLMAGAGFTSVFVGIETPAGESLRETRKHINTTGSMSEKVEKIQRKGIQLMSGFIIGFDADPDDIAERMTACIQEMGIPQAMIGLLTALPDTDLYERLDRDGRILGQTSGNNTHGFALNFAAARPQQTVIDDYKTVLNAAYSKTLKNFFRRCAVLRSRWPGRRQRTGSSPLSFQLRALFGYLWTALCSSYRFNAYWFLLSTLVCKPSFFVEAVTLGVKGHHLWVITRNAFEVEGMRSFLVDRLQGYHAYLQARSGVLRELLTKAGAQMETTGGDLSVAWEALKNSESVANASEELRALYAKAEEAAREAESYRRRIVSEAETRFYRLSASAKISLRQEMDGFLKEADRLLGGLRLETPQGSPGL